ncbi:MAG: aminotransferase class I/II-fold pyridoxal phosphate-dependent enzyme [bacterium]
MKRDQDRTPYLDAILKYVKDGTLTFHCPGHQQGKGAHKRLRDLIGKSALQADITQVLGLDDIHQPFGPVLEAQELAARAYGADYTHFLINGSSSGNQAMIMAACNPGEEIIIPRNAHKSTISALILSGAIPAYVMPEFDYLMHVDHSVTLESVKKSLLEHPAARAVLLVSPTYYGFSADLERIEKLVHGLGKMLLVDEAWGPHLHFHPDLPLSATAAGADLCVNSTHKIIGGLSQTSMLHQSGNRVDRGRLQSVLRIFLSTSPNSLLIASMDVARMQMATEGKKLLSRAIRLGNYLREKINAIPGFRCYGEEIVGKPGAFDMDPTRITFTARELGLTGYEIERHLRYRHNIQIEMAELFNIVVLITIGHSRKDVDTLVAALRSISREYQKQAPLPSPSIFFDRRRGRPVELPDWPPQRLAPREAFTAGFATIPLKSSAGRICTELVTPYPPGIPILCPGEEITQDIIDYLDVEMAAGVHIQGPVDPLLETIRVVK